MSINTMQSAHDAPRCRAKSNRTGLPCRSPAVTGHRVCRMHGARGGAPEGKQNGNFRHGDRTKESIQAVSYINSLSREAQILRTMYDSRCLLWCAQRTQVGHLAMSVMCRFCCKSRL